MIVSWCSGRITSDSRFNFCCLISYRGFLNNWIDVNRFNGSLRQPSDVPVPGSYTVRRETAKSIRFMLSAINYLEVEDKTTVTPCVRRRFSWCKATMKGLPKMLKLSFYRGKCWYAATIKLSASSGTPLKVLYQRKDRLSSTVTPSDTLVLPSRISSNDECVYHDSQLRP